ncbi:hypothetical protein [Streptomyces chartreusis]|uniref:Uncharacterized protein n=1 Tax=Streptomyces chartreusis TaxID=1969 RepID=A0A7H8TJY9_STRCX|nr:hypothetical protein [Streptomyces chartreusis]QKZ23831.1 hypothetical protein HUT05_44635 [Streptomyces chartreusis]
MTTRQAPRATPAPIAVPGIRIIWGIRQLWHGQAYFNRQKPVLPRHDTPCSHVIPPVEVTNMPEKSLRWRFNMDELSLTTHCFRWSEQVSGCFSWRSFHL